MISMKGFSCPALRRDDVDPAVSAQCLDRPTVRGCRRLSPWHGDRHRTQYVSRFRSWRRDDGSAHRGDRAALAAGLSSTRRSFGDVSRSAAFRAMVCSSGRTAIHARRGDFFRSDEPVAEQLAAIPRATSNREQDLMSLVCRHGRMILF